MVRGDASYLLSQIDNIVTSVRRIASDLRATLLDDLGLLPGIEWLAEEFSWCVGIMAYIQLTDDDLEFSDTAAKAIFCIVQEALTNVAWHAHATEVTITIAIADRQCEISIKDNGQAALAGGNEKPSSFRLMVVRERVRQLDGTVSFGNGAAGGFRVQISLPVEAITRR